MAEVMEAAVLEMFQMVMQPDRAWTLDWLMRWDTDPAGDVSALASPISLSQAQASLMSAVIEPFAELGVNEESGVEAVYTRVPTWTQAGVTVGVAIDDVRSIPGLGRTPFLVSDNAPSRTFGRFVRDEMTGETLGIMKLSEHVGYPARCSMVHLRNDSTTMRKHSFMVCDYRIVVARGSSPWAFAKAVLLLENSYGLRSGGCPVCWMAPGAYESCSCKLPLVCPRTSLDFSNFQNNAVFDCAEFTCTSTIFLTAEKPDGKRSDPIVLRKRTCFTGRSAVEAGAKELTDMLHVLALQDRIGEANPVRAVMPFMESMQGSRDRVSSPPPNASLGCALEPPDPVLGVQTSGSSTRIEIQGAEPVSAVGRRTHCESRAPNPNESLSNANPSVRAANSVYLEYVLGEQGLSAPFLPASTVDSALFSRGGSCSVRSTADCTTSGLNLPAPDGGAVVGSMYVTAVTNEAGLSRSGDVAGAQDGAPRSDTCRTLLSDRNRPDNAVAPQPDIAEVPGADVGKLNSKVSQSFERRRKNRLAAARSNARRKECREHLTAALEEAKNRKDGLEKRLEEVRVAHTELKIQVADLWLSKSRKKGLCP